MTKDSKLKFCASAGDMRTRLATPDDTLIFLPITSTCTTTYIRVGSYLQLTNIWYRKTAEYNTRLIEATSGNKAYFIAAGAIERLITDSLRPLYTVKHIVLPFGGILPKVAPLYDACVNAAANFPDTTFHVQWPRQVGRSSFFKCPDNVIIWNDTFHKKNTSAECNSYIMSDDGANELEVPPTGPIFAVKQYKLTIQQEQ